MRLHLFEFEDQKWFPHVVREGMMDYLRHMISWMQFYKPAAPLIKDLLDQTGNTQIIELCAGAGGGVVKLKSYLNEINCYPKIFLSDLYPNFKAYELLHEETKGAIDFIPEPVNALKADEKFDGIRIMFSAFHHFNPEQAKTILKDAAEKKIPIAIFDAGTTRWLYILLLVCLLPFSFFFLTPFFKPFRWSRIFFTYLIPLIPLCTIWDGSVSVLRFYSVKEMKQLTKEAEAAGYKWQTGMKKNPFGIPANYIIGMPVK